MRISITIILLYISAITIAQTYTISGYVKDAGSGEDMIGASVLIKEINKGTITNTYGYYSISVKKGTYTLIISFLGFADIEKKIILDKNLKFDFSLEETSFTTDEVVISAERTDKNVRSNTIGVVKLPMETVKKLPAFMGEVDIIKSIQLMPGVSSAGEGNGGFYVRGGGPDQNLVLLDGATVYNASHLFGFFSVFNADAIKDVNLIKGGMPAKYGGRLSSVLDISMKEGNNKKFEVQGGIGNIASRLTVQGPIIKDKASFIVSGRRTYIDILMDPFVKETAKAKGSGYYFYDITGKVNYKFSNNDRIFLSGYYGKDVFSFVRKDKGFDVHIPWGNAMGTIRWNHLFNRKLFMNTTFVISDYNFAFEAEQDNFELKMYSGIRDYSAKVDLTWFAHVKHKIYFGGEYIRHVFTPSTVSGTIGSTNFDSGKINKQYANDFAIYLMDEYEYNEFFSVTFGLRATLYQNVGPYDRYIINDQNINTDTIIYNKGDVIAQYPNIEPRISMRYMINSKSSLKASFTQNYQYVHLANVASATLPTDVWVSSTDVVKPQFSTQYSLGYFRNFKKNMFETSIEIYYKDMQNMIEYADGKTPGDDVGNNADNNFVFGNGYSYGAEFFIKKSFGKINGWIGYTISKTARIFPDINHGLEFPAKYDRRNDLSVIASYEFSKKLSASIIFIYATGDASTLPLSRYMIDGKLSVEYGARNSFRMSAYHRADFSVSWEPGALKKKRFKSTWVFAVYNLYNRYNPYFIYFDESGSIQEGDYKVSAMQVSLFPILPSITWNFKF